MAKNSSEITESGMQLPLTLSFGAGISMDSFCVCPSNVAAYNYMNESVNAAREERRFLYLYGPSGSGKTHLIKGATLRAEAMGMHATVLDMAKVSEFDWDSMYTMMVGVESYDVILLDNIDAIAGNSNLEAEIFSLYNRWLGEPSGFLAVASHESPTKSGFGKRDLISRFSSGVTLSVDCLPQEMFPEMLMRREKAKGGILPASRAEQISRRVDNIRDAVKAVDLVDDTSIANKKGVTKNLVNQVLDRLFKKEDDKSKIL